MQKLIDHRAPLSWLKDPSDMIDRARLEAQRITSSAQNQCPLSDVDRRSIEELEREADRLVQIGTE